MAKISIHGMDKKSVMVVSRAVYDEIELRLRMTANEAPFHIRESTGDDIIDMVGICLARDTNPEHVDGPETDLKTMLIQEGERLDKESP
jgi:hypothetical protein